MLQLQHISLAFGGQQVLDGVTWTITPGQRIGLIGPNGAGKSTLLRVIAGRQTPDEGTVAAGSTTVGYLAQDVQEVSENHTVVQEALQAFDEVLALQDEEHRITQELAEEADHTTPRYEKLLHALEHVHARLVTHEAHRIRDRTEAVLTGLGFEPDELERPLHTFSGGWRMRVALAKLLLRRPDVLLLDEPTNHLDIESIDWLESYLQTYAGTVVIVSHDRYFLDRMVRTIAELFNGQLTEYAGNYTFYLEERDKRRALQQSAYENQQREIVEIERFIERFRYKASKAKQVQSRVKMLEKMERIPPPPSEQASIGFRFPEPRKSGRAVMELSRFTKVYPTPDGPLTVFDDAGPLLIERGDKIALIGKNGAGKSTLARMLVGTESFEGTRELGYHVELNYFAQHQAEALDPRHTVLEAMRERARGHGDTALRTMLGAFLFQGDDVFKPVRVLSGGEKSRLALARTLLAPANFLILDEPTNHLDIQSTAVLIEALQQFTGTFVVVSHDRHFLDQVVNRVWHVGHGEVTTFPGTYSEYRWREARHADAANAAPDAPAGGAAETETPRDGIAAQPDEAASGPKTKEQKRREAEARRRLYDAIQSGENVDFTLLNPYQLRKIYQQTEADILKKEARQAELEAALGDPSLYEDGDRALETTAAYEAVQADLAGLYDRWERLAEYLATQDA